METVKIVFDIDSKDVKTTTEELKALNKVTNEEVAAMDKLSNAATDAGDGFVSLRTQVKQAKEEAQRAAEKYGEFSKEANAARVKAGALADQMGDLNRQVSLLNPEAKAKAFSNLAQGVVGAFSIATGAVQAFGIKNKEVEAVAQKLQAALNITQGIAQIGQLKEAYQDIKVVLGFTTAAQEALTVANTTEAASATAAATATRGFTAALITNPVFLVVAALGALAGAMFLLGEDTDDTSNSFADFTAENKKLQTALDSSKEAANKAALAMIDLKVAKGEMSAADATIAKNNMALAQSTEEVKKSITSNTTTIAAYRKMLIDAKKQYDQDVANAEKEARLSGNLNANRILEVDKKNAKARYDATVADVNARIKKEQEILKANQSTLTSLTSETESKNTVATIDGIDQRNNERKRETEEAKRLAEERKQELAKREKELNDLLLSIMTEGDDYQIAKLKEKDDERKAVEKANLSESQRARLLAVKGNALEELKVKGQILDENYKRDIFNAEMTGKDTSAITAKYNNDKTELAQDTADKEVAINKDKNAQMAEDDAERLAKAKEVATGIFDSANFLGQLAFENRKRETDQELQNLEDQKNKKLITEEQYQAQLKVIKRKQAEDEKKQAIFNATIDLSRAIIAALTIPPPGSITAAAFAAALAGANLAKIIATPLPKYQKGTLAVPGIDMGRDSVHAMLQPGEAVIPVSTNRAYHPTIKAIYEKKISPSEINSFVMSRTSAGGKQSVTANVDTYALGRVLGKNKGVQIENAQAVGRVIARELSNHNIRRG